MSADRADAGVSNHFALKVAGIAGIAVRSIFILLIAGLTARVASPQIETLSTLLDTPDDLVRVILGLAVCVWCLVNLFILPKDIESYRTWLYLGAAVLPLSFLVAVIVW